MLLPVNGNVLPMTAGNVVEVEVVGIVLPCGTTFCVVVVTFCVVGGTTTVVPSTDVVVVTYCTVVVVAGTTVLVLVALVGARLWRARNLKERESTVAEPA